MANKKASKSPAKKAAQKQRTKQNKQAARDRHSAMHPNDKQAPQAWKNYPLG